MEIKEHFKSIEVNDYSKRKHNFNKQKLFHRAFSLFAQNLYTSFGPYSITVHSANNNKIAFIQMDSITLQHKQLHDLKYTALKCMREEIERKKRKIVDLTFKKNKKSNRNVRKVSNVTSKKFVL